MNIVHVIIHVQELIEQAKSGREHISTIDSKIQTGQPDVVTTARAICGVNNDSDEP